MSSANRATVPDPPADDNDDEPMTTTELLDKLSFSPEKKKQQEEESPLKPHGPPPFCPPPPPPGESSYQHGDSLMANFSSSSYQQQQQQQFYDSRNQETTTTQKMEEEEPIRVISAPPVFRYYGGADASVDPNVARSSNVAEGESLALGEMMWRMRLVNIVVCALSLLTEVPFFWIKLFSPTQLVLGGYLIFFASLLCCFELHLFPNTIDEAMIRDQFGLLYHPLGRALFLVLMGGLSVGQGGIWGSILGAVLVANAVYHIYAYIRYPLYRKLHEEHRRSSLVRMARDRVSAASYASWANPESSSSVRAALGAATSERQSLVV